MATNTIYLDQEDGLLCYKEGGDQFIPVKVLAETGLQIVTTGEYANLLLFDGGSAELLPVKDLNGDTVKIALYNETKDEIELVKKDQDIIIKNIWNPVLYKNFDSTMHSDIYMDDDGTVKLFWKYNDNTPENKLTVSISHLNTKNAVQFADRNYVSEQFTNKNFNSLATAKKTVVGAINEALYNVWNPVHYGHYGSSSESKIVLTDLGQLKLTWKYGQNPEATEKSVFVETADGSSVYFADRDYVRQFSLTKEIETLNTVDKTIVGAINELALLQNLPETISHKCNESYQIKFSKIDQTLSTGIEYILEGSVRATNGLPNLACVIAIPTDSDYNNPNRWGEADLSEVEYQNDIKIIDFGSTFTLDKESVLYLAFMSHQDISIRLSHLGTEEAWKYDGLYIGTTISVTGLNIIPSSESQARQLENQKEIIDQLGLQVLQLQTQLLELTNKISWLDQLDQEGLVKSWGKEAN